MTREQCEMALIKLGEAAMEIVKIYNPEINNVGIYFSTDGYIGVSGARFDGHKLVEIDVLDASKYRDGHIRLGGKETAA